MFFKDEKQKKSIIEAFVNDINKLTTESINKKDSKEGIFFQGLDIKNVESKRQAALKNINLAGDINSLLRLAQKSGFWGDTKKVNSTSFPQTIKNFNKSGIISAAISEIQNGRAKSHIKNFAKFWEDLQNSDDATEVLSFIKEVLRIHNDYNRKYNLKESSLDEIIEPTEFPIIIEESNMPNVAKALMQKLQKDGEARESWINKGLNEAITKDIKSSDGELLCEKYLNLRHKYNNITQENAKDALKEILEVSKEVLKAYNARAKRWEEPTMGMQEVLGEYAYIRI